MDSASALSLVVVADKSFKILFQNPEPPDTKRPIITGPVKPVKHVLELLHKIQAQGLDIYIVTGSAQRSLLNTLHHHFGTIFEKEKMVTAFDVKYGKPNPEPYLMALQKAKIEPWQAVVIENAPLGIQAGVGAGIFTIGVNTGILEDKVLLDAGAHVVYPSMHELLTQWTTIYD